MVPLCLCNAIGASLEVVDPAEEHWIGTVPGAFLRAGHGRTPDSRRSPWFLPYPCCLLSGRFDQGLASAVSPVDIRGVSWGGALAQQFAFQYPRRCRRLILVSTGVRLSAMLPVNRGAGEMLTPRRFFAQNTPAAIAVTSTSAACHRRLDWQAAVHRQLMGGSRVGRHQLLAGSVWTSLPVLPLVRQPTLIIAGTDDPIVPFANARIMARLLPPCARLHCSPAVHVG